MRNFDEIIKEQKLSNTSSFPEIAQAAIASYYLKPYPGAMPAKNGVHRRHHGGVHASFTALNVEMIFELYKKYKPELLKHPLTGRALTEKDLDLLKLAAIYHDSANVSEIKGDAKEHADNFRRDMVALGWKAQEIEPFAMAIQNKDGNNKNILEKIVHDADCLDIIRVANDNFDKNYLDIIKDLKECPNFLSELDAIIQNHFLTIDTFKGESANITPLHQSCETADNCYIAVYNAQVELLKKHIVFSCLKKEKIISYEDIDLSKVSILDLYNRENSTIIKNLIEKLREEKIEDSKNHINTLDTLFNEGCVIRGLSFQSIDDELATLNKNAKVLQENKLESTMDLKKFIYRQIIAKEEKINTPKGFKWRPCSFYQADLPVEFVGAEVAFIIDPNPEKGTKLSYFYKQNIFSAKAESGQFNYYFHHGEKNRPTLEALRKKIWEQEQRRRGHIPDKGYHYYGKNSLKYSEILGTYQKTAISGIIAAEGEKNTRDAILLRAKLGKPFRPIYRYSSEKTMISLSEETLLKESGLIATKPKENALVDNINEHISGTFVLEEPLYHGIIIKKMSDNPLPFCRKTLMYRWNPGDKNNAICTAMKKIKICTIEEAFYSSQSIIGEKIEKEDSLTLVLDLLWDDRNDIKNGTTFLLNALQDIEKAAINPGADVSSNDFNVGDISEIQFHEKENHLKFTFKHPRNSETQCEAFVNEKGIPTLRFLTSGDQKYFEQPTTLLPNIAKRHAEYQISSFNIKLKIDVTYEFLKEEGIDEVGVQLKTTNNKLALQWCIRLIDKNKILQMKDIIAKKLYDKFTKVNTISIQSNLIIITTPYIQQADIEKTLKEIFNFPKNLDSSLEIKLDNGYKKASVLITDAKMDSYEIISLPTTEMDKQMAVKIFFEFYDKNPSRRSFWPKKEDRGSITMENILEHANRENDIGWFGYSGNRTRAILISKFFVKDFKDVNAAILKINKGKELESYPMHIFWN